jgi:GNAT superfamily N-acetyltransferase
MIGFRQAEATDEEAIGLLIEQCFQETPNKPQIRDSLERAQDHAVYVAVDDDQVVGFVSGFNTTSVEGVLRWEVDLLAVKPGFQGQGIGRQLINTSYETGRRSGAALARALIGEQNAASQRAFVSNGFIASEPMALYIWYPQPQETMISRFNVVTDALPGVITVSTLTYRGLWLEGELTEPMILTAKQRLFVIKERLNMVGAVVPKRQSETIRLLEHSHFVERNTHRSWQKRF